MYARIPTFQIAPDRIDAAIREFKEVTVPKLRALHGFKGTTMMVDRDKGMFRVLGFWEDRQALDASGDATKALRDDIGMKLGAELVSLEIMEVAADVYPEKARDMVGAGMDGTA
jgi:quinol monooxygenase YgiN